MPPVLVEVLRGDVIESLHRGHAVVADAGGVIVEGWGDVNRPTYPRSAVKPLQALPLIESGAADRFGLGDEEIALACASHGGEEGHVARVAAWLARIGLAETDLECGGHWPGNAEAARRLAVEGRQPGPLHNNCSGKHAGFLTTVRYLGEDPAGYIGREHPVQRRVVQALAEMTGCDVDSQPWGVDGCGIPTFALPLSALAIGMARLAALPRGTRIRSAMAAHPWLVAGTGRLCSELMAAAPHVLAKGGAEGVYTAMIPARGIGIALKIDDGAGRAAEAAVMAVLDRLGCFDDGQRAALAGRLRPVVNNVAGRTVGTIRVRL